MSRNSKNKNVLKNQKSRKEIIRDNFRTGKNTVIGWLQGVARHVATLDLAAAKKVQKKERRLVPGSAENEEALIKKTWENDAEPITKYCSNFSLHERPLLQRLREETLADDPRWEMIVDPLQMQLLTMLARSINAKNTLDIGVFTGYSTLLSLLIFRFNW